MPTEGGAAVPVPESELVLRPAEPDDADALALIHVLARRAAPMPDPVHPDDDATGRDRGHGLGHGSSLYLLPAEAHGPWSSVDGPEGPRGPGRAARPPLGCAA